MKSQFKTPSDIKVGVVGYGGAFNMGKQHLLQMQSAGMTPVAVAEIDESRLQVASSDFPGIGVFNSVDKMLTGSDVNLIVIITPHNTHAPVALQCLEQGRHVVCEKPLAITTSEVDQMISAATKSGVMLSTYHNRHWDGRILDAVKRIREEKVIGEIVRIECHMGQYGMPGDWWRTSRSISGGILYDWGVHLLEYSLQLIPEKIIEVSGYAFNGFWGPKTKWADDANEDEAFCVVRFHEGKHLTLTITQIDSRPKAGWVEVTGTLGTYLFGGDFYEVTKIQSGVTHTEKGSHSEDRGHLYYENIRDHLVDGANLVITPEWSRRPIHILDLARQSADGNRSLPAIYP